MMACPLRCGRRNLTRGWVEELKNLRFILALIILLAPSVGVRAQVSVAVPPAAATPQPTPAQPVSVSPLPTSASDTAVAEDVLPQAEELPTLGHQGVLVETLDGNVVRDQASDQPFNPASAVKLTTALDALRTFGPKHRFATTFWLTGTFDKTTSSSRRASG